MKHSMSVRDHIRVHMALFWAGVAIVVVGGIFSKPLQPHWLIWVGIVVFLFSLLYRLITVKCPHCGNK